VRREGYAPGWAGAQLSPTTSVGWKKKVEGFTIARAA
jgi:hypothetical protein